MDKEKQQQKTYLIDRDLLMVVDTPPSDVWQHLLEVAVSHRASDIHLSYQADGLHVAFRIDGQLMPQGVLADADQALRVTNHVEVTGGMDVADRRRPQSGRATAQVEGRNIDLRISMMPSNHGPDVVVRVLDREVSLLSMEQLGLTKRAMNRLSGLITMPTGMILVTGPTGAGKTTTLYAILSKLNDGSRKIITIENPVEYDLIGINQSQLNYRLGVDYHALLLTALQHDPDVLMIGEVRDPETAATAVRAAATGHLVLATMHANGSAEAVTSLMNLGAHPHFVARTLRGVIAQNLVRRVCPECAQRIEETESVLPLDDVRPLMGPDTQPALVLGKGCENCHFCGYKGRLGLFEILVMEEEVSQVIERNGTTEEIHEAAARTGMLTLWQAGKIAAFSGQTTVEELLRSLSWQQDRVE